VFAPALTKDLRWRIELFLGMPGIALIRAVSEI
jgi:hypothetical protein